MTHFFTGPVNIYFKGSVDKGSLTILFENIHGSAELHFGAGSVVLRGSLDYCIHPCGVKYTFEQDEKKVPPGLEKKTCNPCTENSFLNLNFKTVEHVLFHKFYLGAYGDGLSGGAVVKADDVQTFRVQEGSMRQVRNAGIKAGGCWNDYNEVSCLVVLGSEDSSERYTVWSVMLPIVSTISGLITIAIIFCVIKKHQLNRETAVPTTEMAHYRS